jgi:hypothetical protein
VCARIKNRTSRSSENNYGPCFSLNAIIDIVKAAGITVSKVTDQSINELAGCMMDYWDFDSRQGQQFFSSPALSDRLWDSPSLMSSRVQRFFARKSVFSFFRSFLYTWSRGSSGSIVSDYGLDDRGSIPDRGGGFFF